MREDADEKDAVHCAVARPVLTRYAHRDLILT
jgi:hypothetical protein